MCVKFVYNKTSLPASVRKIKPVSMISEDPSLLKERQIHVCSVKICCALCVACMQGVSISGGSRIFKKRFWFYKKFSSELFEEQKKGHNQLLSTFQRHKLNLARSNAPNLSHYTCITWRMHSLTSKGGVALPLRNFNTSF